jgi:hypothetical protein
MYLSTVGARTGKHQGPANSIHEKVIFCQNKLYTEFLATNSFSLYCFVLACCFDTHGVSVDHTSKEHVRMSCDSPRSEHI